MLRVCVLGRLATRAGDRLHPVANPRQQRILAALTIAHPTALSVEQLVERVWDDGDAPASPAPSLRTYVSRLRSVADDEQADLIATRPGGYVLGAAPEEIDSRLFETRLRDAREELDPYRRLALLDQALTSWDHPYPGLDGLFWVRPEVSRLERLRLDGEELWLEILLATGRHADAAIAGAGLLEEHPLRESIRRLRTIALYRSGRQAEAMAELAAHRRVLAEEMGLDPSPELQQLEADILRQAPSLRAPEAMGRRVRGYRLGVPVGEGAHGVVYRAVQPSVGRDVAIKVIRRELANDPEFVRRFEREAQVVARLEHPYIVPLHDYWREAERAFLVMRWLDGGTVDDELADGPLSLARAGRIVAQVASALDFAHRQGVVHRDVKPSNILLDTDGNAYLSDFGVAGAAADALVPGPLPSASHLPPEVRGGGRVTAAADVWSLARTVLSMLAARDGQAAMAVDDLLGHVPPVVAGVLRQALAVSPEDRHRTALDLAAALADRLGGIGPLSVAAVPAVNPYRGLSSFEEADQHAFFGRDDIIDEVLARLRSEPLAIVVGPSGSGKSSLVRAGVVPRLRARHAELAVAVVTPGTEPLAALARGIESIATRGRLDIRSRLATDPLPDVVAAVTDAPVALVVDQLEEVLTLGPASEAERVFELLATAADAGAPLRVLAVLRADFLGHPLWSPTLGPVVGSVSTFVPPMRADQIALAVGEPARRLGVTYDDGVLARLVDESEGRAGALPMLQFALTRMFDERTGNRVDLATFDRVGGVTGALVAASEQQLDDSDSDERPIRQLFLRLVRVGEDQITRRRAPLTELLDVDGVDADLVERLASARLLTLDRDPTTREPTVEVSHEALLEAWPRLRSWVNDARRSLLEAQQLRSAASTWEAAGNDPDLLFRGRRLAAARALLDRGDVAVAPRERRFVAAANAAEQAAAVEDRARATARERSARFRRRARVGGLVAAVLLSSAVWVGVSSRRQADRDRAVAAQAELLSAASAFQDTGRTDLGILLAVEAWARDPGAASQRTLLDVLRSATGTNEIWSAPRFDVGTSFPGCLTEPEPGVFVVQPNSFAGGFPDSPRPVLEIDVRSRQIVGRIDDSPAVCEVRRGVTTAGDVRFAASGDAPDELVVVDPSGAVVAGPFPGLQFPIFLPDGRLIAKEIGAPGFDEIVEDYVVVDLDTDQTSPTSLAAESIQITEDGRWLWAMTRGWREQSGGFLGATLLDAVTLEAVVDFGDRPMSPVVSGNGDLVAVEASDAKVVVLDPETGETIIEIPGRDAWDVAIGPDGNRVAIVRVGGELEIYSLPDGTLLSSAQVGPDEVMGLHWADQHQVAALLTTGVVVYVEPGRGALIDPGPLCCARSEFTLAVPHGEPNPYVYYEDRETGIGTFHDVETGAQSTVDMSAWTLDGHVDERRLPDGSALLVTESGALLVVDRGGRQVARVEPFGRDYTGGMPDLVSTTRAGLPPYLVVGAVAGDQEEARALRLVSYDAPLQVVGGPVDVTLEHRGRVDADPGGIVKVWRSDQPGTVDVYDTTGSRLATLDLEESTEWVRVTPDLRFALVYDGADDSITRIDLGTGDRAVLSADGEPERPVLLPDGHFLIQTRQGELELWDVDGPTRIGVLADPGPYTFTFPTAHPDGSEVWIVLNGRWVRIPLSPDEWARRACDVAGRALTEQEWTDFVPGDKPYRDACATV